ncbi:MAG: hypothetical protein AB1798_10445 [Spirochaetota bacterium]
MAFKTHNTILLVLIVKALLISNIAIIPLHADQELKELVIGKVWHIPDIFYGYIMFDTVTYRMGAYEGAGDFAIGRFVILDSRRISLCKPTFYNMELEIVKQASSWANSLWTREELLLKYNTDYANIYYSGSLDNELGKVVFVSTNPTSEGATIKEDGIEIVKEKASFIVLENLIMCKKPNRESESNYYEIEEILYKYGYQTVKKERARIVPKGYELTTIARTVTADVIDGQRASWYFYNIETEDFIYHGWVFGGHLTPYSKEKDQEYRRILEKNLMEMGWIQPKQIEH